MDGPSEFGDIPEMPRPITETLRVESEPLAEASCVTCGSRVWVFNQATPPLAFDLEHHDGEPHLFMHDCSEWSEDLETETDDDEWHL